jgi:hypothetical protein
MAKIKCVRCGTELGFLSIKHKTDDGLVVCNSCIIKWEQEKYIEKIKKAGAWEIFLKIAEKHRDFLNDNAVLAHQVLVDGQGYSEAIINLEMERALAENPDVEKVEVSYDGEPNHQIEEDFKNLIELLSSKYGVDINKDLLLDAMYTAIVEVVEIKRPEKYERFKKMIASENPQSKEDYADAILKQYGEDFQENIPFLTMLLNEKEIILDSSQVLALLNERKKILELDTFEKRLLWGDPSGEIDFDSMNGFEFERFLGDLFKKMGYIVMNTKLSGDQGADLVVERFGEKTAIQAKCYSGTVGNTAIQEVVAAKNHYGCHKTLVITTSYFTPSAMSLANSNNVELWDRNKLDEIIQKHGD